MLSIALSGHAAPASKAAELSVPSEGAYMVRSLQAYANAYWARVAGRDTGLAPHTNGHDEFAARWSRDMLAALAGLHAGVIDQPFPTPGFRDLPAGRPGMNVIVAVPGSKHPDRAVVIGAHYDGEPTSKGSAYDDASGCVVMLGLARALGAIWRTQGPPSLTVEFVLFDAEEQGLVGSLYYNAAARRSAMPSPVVMIDEEQSGIGYPVHPFGLASRDPLPMIASTSERLPGAFSSAPPVPLAAEQQLNARLGAAISGAFAQLRTQYSPISFRGGARAVFTAADRRLIQTGASPECCSDNDPFQVRGVPNVTFSGNFDFYDTTARPWSYPFDQPWDTFSALACDSGGSPRASRALEAALDLPMGLSALLVQRYAPATAGRGLAVFSTPAQQGHAVRFRAIGGSVARWEFADGSWSAERVPSHTYRRAGTYRVRLTGIGISSVWTLRVASGPLSSRAPFGVLRPPAVRPWQPQELHGVRGCETGSG